MDKYGVNTSRNISIKFNISHNKRDSDCKQDDMKTEDDNKQYQNECLDEIEDIYKDKSDTDKDLEEDENDLDTNMNDIHTFHKKDSIINKDPEEYNHLKSIVSSFYNYQVRII